MGTFPTTPRTALLTWCQARSPVWAAQAANIGLTDTQAADFDTAVSNAAAKLVAQQTAQQAAKMATEAANDAFRTLRSLTGGSVKSIRSFAEASGDPQTVYQLAQIPSPAQPSPAPPPAKPTDLRVSIDPSSGALTLRWKATNPASGTGYIIRRRALGESQFSFVGVTGTKSFTDTTFIAGPNSVSYTVQGTRSGINGPLSNIFTINFGASPEGGMQAFVTDEGESDGGGANGGAKLAA
jgi:hypothetical protein